MAWRNTGGFHKASPIQVEVCDHCGRDIGHHDGFRSRSHYEVIVNFEDAYSEGSSKSFCSAECLLGAAQAIVNGESNILEKLNYEQ